MKRKQRRKAVSFLGGLLAACALALALGNQEEAGRANAPLSYGELTVSRNAPRFVAAPEDYQNIAISQVSDYVNIRSAPTTSGTIVGKIYNNCAATILQSVQGEGGVWYQIQSGSVNGYIKAQYFITGAQAEAIAKEIGVQYATVDTASLRLREQPSLSSAILTTLPQGAEYVVLGESNHFAHLSVDEDLTGYVSMDYIKTRIAFKQAVSLEEEAAKLAEELEMGEITLRDIVKELEKPARDPREEMPKPILRTDVLEMKDLKEGMILKGTVRNVIDFGVFVDIGVHQDGLVHISQITEKFIKHPLEAVSVGDIVDVKVMSVDLKKKRIQLTMRGIAK